MSDPQQSLTRANPTAEDAPFLCEDCGHACSLHFCENCGQARVPPPKTLLGILGDFLGQYFNLEGKLWRTLVLLLRHPGKLTQEYFSGKRTRYFTPVRLYLTLSLLFFTVASFTSPTATKVSLNIGDAKAAIGDIKDPEARAEAEEALQEANEALKALGPAASMPTVKLGEDLWWLPGIDEIFAKLSNARTPEEKTRHQKQFHAQMMAQSPRVLFLLLPLFAAFFKVAFRKRCFYSEAFVFTLHLHCVIFIAVLLSVWLPAWIFGFAAVGHGLLAMKRVFGQGWIKTNLKAAFIALAYTSTLGTVAGLLAYRVVLDL